MRAAERKATVTGVSDRALAAAVAAAVGEVRTPVASRLDARRRASEAAAAAADLLRSEGYYDAVITPDIGEGEKPKPTIKVELGPRTTIKSAEVAFEGPLPDAATMAAARAALALKPNAPGRAVDVIAAEGRVIAVLQEHGYADAAAQPRVVTVDHADTSLVAVYHVAAGAVVRMDGLQLDHVGRTSRRWLRKLTPWKVNEVYRPELVAELERRLLDTQAYDAVTVALAPKPDADGRRPVVVNLADRPRGALDFSAGYSTTEGADFDVRYSIFNRLRRADTLTLQARLAEIDSRFGGELALPDWLRPNQTLKPSLYYLRTVTDAYTETGPQVALDVTRRYGKTSFLTVGSSITASRVDDNELGAENIQLYRVYTAFLWDRSDNSLDPAHGFKLDARLTPTQITGDDSLTYLKATVQGSVYFAFDTRADNVLAVRSRIGSILGGSIHDPRVELGTTPGVPASDRFYAGGGGSVRGYGYQDVGPHYADNTPKGGLSLFEASLEFRHRFRDSPLGVVGFVDAGSVGPDSSPNFTRISPAVGVGVRYSLGFAPIRADIAVPLDKLPGASQSFQVYLSIGQAF